MSNEDDELDEKLEALREEYDTVALLNSINCLPDDLRDDAFKLHTMSMAVVNNDDNSQAKEMFELAADLSEEMETLIDYHKKFKKQLDKLCKYDPEN